MVNGPYTFEDIPHGTYILDRIPGIVFDSIVYRTSDTAHNAPGGNTSYAVIAGAPGYMGNIGATFNNPTGSVRFSLGHIDEHTSTVIDVYRTLGSTPETIEVNQYGTAFYDLPGIVKRFVVRQVGEPSGVSLDNLSWGGAGRLKVRVSEGEGSQHEWKFANPFPGENGGRGRLKVKRRNGWVNAKGGLEG